MLPRDQRLTRPDDFSRTYRAGSRASSHTVVVHIRRHQNPPGSTRVGFVVSKKVGGAVTRNRVKRRLRHLTRELTLPWPGDVIVRALPGAAAEDAPLAKDLGAAWEKALRRAEA